MPCPVFPTPIKHKAKLLKIFFGKRRSWLDGLYERSYSMKMGHVRLPGLDIFMVNQPDLVRRIMVEDIALFPKHRLLGEILKPLLGESIFTTNGPQWKAQRDMLDPAFAYARVQHVFGLMQDAVSDLMSDLASKESSRWVDMDHHMTRVTADIIFRTIMSVSLKPEVADTVIKAFERFQAETPKFALKRMFKVPGWFGFGQSEQRRRKAAHDIRSVIESIVRPRYLEARRDVGAPAVTDILSSLLMAKDASSGAFFSLDEIVDQVSMLFLAGHETSASALTWALYLLALHPEIQESAYTEAVGALQGGSPSIENIKKMPLVRDVFREALRLYPPVGFFARECEATTSMRDKTLPIGSAVMVSPWLIHRHRDYWDNPDGFDPGRFSRDQPKAPLRDIYLPFGTGPRVCIGAAFALQEAVLILSSLLTQYRFELLDGFTPEPVGRLTIRSENGMRLVLKRR